jgi:hypothetical protein
MSTTQNRSQSDIETPRRRQDDPGSTNVQPGIDPDDRRAPRKNPPTDSPNRPEDLPEQRLGGSKVPGDRQQNQERPNQGGDRERSGQQSQERSNQGDHERSGQQSGNQKQGQQGRSGKQ